MAYLPCNIGGGGMTETLLWENDSPTTTFSAKTITLSDSMDNYDYIKILYYVESRNDAISLYVKSDEIATSSTGKNIRTISGYTGGRVLARYFYKSSDTTIYFSGAQQLNKAYSETSSIKPLAVYGVNV